MLKKRTPAELLNHSPFNYRCNGSVEKLLAAVERAERRFPKLNRNFSIFKLYWGLTEEGSMSLDKIGERFKLSPTRIGQLRNIAFRTFTKRGFWDE